MPSRPILQGVGEDGRAVALDVVRGTAGGDSGGAGRCRFGRPGACGMTTGAHFGARRAAARGTHMKRESPMAIGFLARFVHVRTRFSKPPPSATRPRLRRAKSLENIAFNVNDGSARRAKNAGVAVSGGTKEGTYAAILGQPCSLRVRADFRCHADEPRRQTRV